MRLELSIMNWIVLDSSSYKVGHVQQKPKCNGYWDFISSQFGGRVRASLDEAGIRKNSPWAKNQPFSLFCNTRNLRMFSYFFKHCNKQINKQQQQRKNWQ